MDKREQHIVVSVKVRWVEKEDDFDSGVCQKSCVWQIMQAGQTEQSRSWPGLAFSFKNFLSCGLAEWHTLVELDLLNSADTLCLQHLPVVCVCVCMCMWEHVVCLTLSQTPCMCHCSSKKPFGPFYNQHFFNGMELTQGGETGDRTRMDKIKVLYLLFTACHVDQRKTWYLRERQCICIFFRPLFAVSNL